MVTQDKLNKQIANDEETYKNDPPKEEKSFDIEKYNNQLLVTKIQRKLPIKGRDEVFYYFCNANNEIIRKPDNDPWCAIKDDKGQYVFYKDVLAKFSLTQQDAGWQNNWQAKPIEILAYRQCKYTDNRLEQYTCPITADYDELVSTAAKFYPFDNNNEVSTTFNRNFYNALSNKTPINNEEMTAELLLRYEQADREEARQIRTDQQQPFMGLVNDWQRTFKSVLKIDTNSHTNHGPEVNNPFPEVFPEIGEYPIFYPDKTPKSEKMSEEGICNFINTHRKNGFPLDVNPRWGWEVDQETGKLSVPAKEKKFNWREVDGTIADMAQERVFLEMNRGELLQKYNLKNTDLNAMILSEHHQSLATGTALTLFPNVIDDVIKKLEFKENTEKSEKLNLILSQKNDEFWIDFFTRQEKLETHIFQYYADIRIRDLKLDIEKLKLEPELVYYRGELSSPDQLKRILYTSEGKDFRASVMKLVREKEHRERWEEIEEMEKELSQKNQEYKKKYKSKSLVTAEITKHEKVIDQEEEIIDQAMEQKSEQKNLVFKN